MSFREKPNPWNVSLWGSIWSGKVRSQPELRILKRLYDRNTSATKIQSNWKRRQLRKWNGKKSNSVAFFSWCLETWRRIFLRRKAVKNIKSVPSNALSGSPSVASVSIAKIVSGCWPLIPPVGCHKLSHSKEKTRKHDSRRFRLTIYYQMNLWLRHRLPLQRLFSLYLFVTRQFCSHLVWRWGRKIWLRRRQLDIMHLLKNHKSKR